MRGQSDPGHAAGWSWLGVIGRGPDAADRVLDEAQARTFRFLWAFLPEPSIARDLRFQHLLASRFLSDVGQKSLAFGAIVAVARDGGSALAVVLVGVAALVPSAAFGLFGGAVSDELPKRVALAGVYAAQAAMCFLWPPIFGTGLPVVLMLIFAVSVLGQVCGPTESSVLPLVASDKELGSAAALINLAAAAGIGVGSLLASVIVRSFGIEPVFYLAGALLLIAASRVFDLPVWKKPGRSRSVVPGVRVALEWLAGHPAVATMAIVAVLAGTVNLVLMTLAPFYVESVLNGDAADTVYVLAPSTVGVVGALVSAPSIMRIAGERVAALAGLCLGTACLFSLGLVGEVGSVVDPVNPSRLLLVSGLSLGKEMRTASLLALPLTFGVSLATTSVQTYINRRVPIGYQGRTFALQNAVRDGAAIIPLVSLGAAASEFGTDRVLLVSPFLLLMLGYTLTQLSFRFSERAPPSYLEEVQSLWEEPAPG